MYVRVSSNISNHMYQSIVYAKINLGWFEQYIVLNPNLHCFELVDALDKGRKPPRCNATVIQTRTDGMKEYRGGALLRYKQLCNALNMELKYLFGYPDVCENYAFMAEILSKKTVPAKQYPVEIRDLPDVHEWTYLKTQQDADAFMKLFAGFHDSTIERASYAEDNTGRQEVTVVFDNTGWFGIAELCFEGVELLKIVPPGPNYSREIMEATLRIDENGVLWADTGSEDALYEGSVIQACSVKWRKLETGKREQRDGTEIHGTEKRIQ